MAGSAKPAARVCHDPGLRFAAVALAGLTVAAGALSALAGPRVTLTDRSLAPRTVTTPAGVPVSVLNRGKRPHRVVSSTSAWAAFSLRPGGTRSLRLALPGRYPYKVDKRLGGVIVVVPSPRGTPPYADSHWEGTMHSVGSLPVPDNPCHDEYLTSLTLDVDATGAVTGAGQATAVVPPTCSIQPPRPPPLMSATLTVKGEATAGSLEIQLFPGTLTPNPALDGGFFANWVGPAGVDPPVQVVPIGEAGHAAGDVTVTDTSRYKAGTSTNTYDLRCAACRP